MSSTHTPPASAVLEAKESKTESIFKLYVVWKRDRWGNEYAPADRWPFSMYSRDLHGERNRTIQHPSVEQYRGFQNVMKIAYQLVQQDRLYRATVYFNLKEGSPSVFEGPPLRPSDIKSYVEQHPEWLS